MSEKDLGVDLIRHGTVQLHALGSVFTQDNGRKFVYARAGAAIALGDGLTNDVAEGVHDLHPGSALDQICAGLWPNEGDGSGRARTAVLDNEFFWAQTGGDGLAKAAATVTAGAPAMLTGTAGTFDDIAAAAGNALAAGSGLGVVFLTTTTSGFARIKLT